MRLPLSAPMLSMMSAILLAGCVAGRPPAFDAADAGLVLRPGDNVVVGRAAFTYAGVYASCAGGQATLLANTPYARWRLDRLYGGGAPRVAAIADAPALPAAPGYAAYARHARCGPTGGFEFDGLADGQYVVVAGLYTPGEPRSGLSVRRDVAVYGGVAKAVVLTP